MKKTNLSGFNDLGMDLTPPGRSSHTVVMNQEKVVRLRLRNTGEMIILDPEDWSVLKETRLYDTGNGVITEKGVALEKLIGVSHLRRNPLGMKYDYRKRWYI